MSTSKWKPDADPARRIEALSPARREWLEKRLAGQKLEDAPLKIASILKERIKRVYYVPGTPMYQTLSACQAVGVDILMTRQQSAAIMMSLADSFLRGTLESAVVITPGPGATNAATGMLVAQDNCWPLLVLGGGRPPQEVNRGAFQELESVRFFEPLAKWSARITHGDHIADMIAHGLKVAGAGKPGPVYLEIPEQVLVGLTENPQQIDLPALPSRPDISASRVLECVGALTLACRPLLMLGKGTRWTLSPSKLRELVERLGLPFITGPMAWGLVPDDHALCFNRVFHQAQQDADLVLQIGLRQNWSYRFGSAISADARIINVNIDETGRDLNREPWLNIHADAGEFLDALSDRIGLETGRAIRQRIDRNWLKKLQQRRIQKQRSIDRKCEADQSPISPYRLAAAVNEFAADRMFCVYDGNVTMAAAQQVICNRHPWRRMNAGSNGCIGSGIPFGVGAARSDRSIKVLVLCGDTGFGMSVMELETALRAELQLIVVISNNDGVSGRLPHDAYFPVDARYMTTFIPNLRYDQMVTSIGGYGEYVEHAEDLLPALQRAEESATISCINVRVDGRVRYPGN